MEEHSEKELEKRLPSIRDLMKKSDDFWCKDDDEPVNTNRFAM
ncbi:ECU09_0465 [Encephalitozoon cuniculi GB-M1]|uniref:ECU09_0465 protein n=1 Tax=Encephalitozoon cuniculi (strain GB-M1) TaxID=284813 RepID=A0A1T5PD74_ENCCU|nr:uncharacterized protein ECU09_0465 [Encephalitozoon cuniculi GB-M1]UYI26727.1 hypothetical protein J0A71_03g05640 [Encephalitozoon cuniculi]SKD10703.1 ECU09_0465 [Encephalitozoon cuniculi GB-M1]